MLENPGLFDYQLYFNEEEKPERELETDVAHTFKCMMRTQIPADKVHFTEKIKFSEVRKRGGLLVGWPKDIKQSVMLSEEDLNEYVKAYKYSGFKGPLNWYRNVEVNWEFSKQFAGQTIEQPALIVTVGKDALFPPNLPDVLHNNKSLPRLSKAHIENAGHWVMQEEPDKLNKILLDWLRSIQDQHKSKL